LFCRIRHWQPRKRLRLDHLDSRRCAIPRALRDRRRETRPDKLDGSPARITDLNQPVGDVDASAFVGYRDDKARPLHDGRHIGRIHLEVRLGLLVDAVEDGSQRLPDLRVAVHPFRWQIHAAGRPHHHSVPAPNKNGATRFSGLHPTIQGHNLIAAHSDRFYPLPAYGDVTHRLQELPPTLVSPHTRDRTREERRYEQRQRRKP
jgi:hypothetical protein